MTKEMLMQYKYLKVEAEDLESKCKKAYGKKLEDNKKALDKINKEKKYIEEWINSIPTSRERVVFRLRYIDNLTWQQIAYRINEHDECYPRQNIHDRYLKATEKTE